MALPTEGKKKLKECCTDSDEGHAQLNILMA